MRKLKLNRNNSKDNPLKLNGNCFNALKKLVKDTGLKIWYSYSCKRCGKIFTKWLSVSRLQNNNSKVLLRNFYYCSYCCAKFTCIERYGDPNYRNIDQQKATNMERYNNNCSLHGINQKKTEKAFLEKYGVDNPFKSDKVKQKIKKTNNERYGVDNPMQSEEINSRAVETRLARYGSVMINSGKYKYDGIVFMSSWELYFYIYHKLKHHKIVYEPKSFLYYKSKQYFVDFKVGNKYYEIKGSQFLVYDKFNNIIDMKDPYNSDNDYLAHLKFLCIKEHNVTIIDNFKITRYINYVIKTYRKNIEQFRIH